MSPVGNIACIPDKAHLPPGASDAVPSLLHSWKTVPSQSSQCAGSDDQSK